MSILITGANRGIGAALLAGYADQNRAVIGTSRQGAAPLWALDVTDTASHSALSKRLENTAIDLLICNAGVFLDRDQSLNTGYAPPLWADTFATNVTGVFLTVQTVLPALRRAKTAKIAIISSQLASQENAGGGSYIYRASKAASLNLGRNLAVDLKNEGISVGIYHPGWVRTDMGGNRADISVDDAASGLIEQVDHLSPATTGCFTNWDGSPQQF